MNNIPPRPFPTYDKLSYDRYLNDHLIPNTPFILCAKTTSKWPCISWREGDPTAGPSKPRLNSLRPYEDHVVPVADTLTREFSEFQRDERPLGEVLDIWERGEGEGLYVKDWHLFEELEKRGLGVESVYTVPKCLRDDWLNPSFSPPSPRHPPSSEQKDQGDFRFCYLGPAGTFTPLHRDVYASYSWSANIVGRKLWWFFSREALERVKDGNGELVFDVRDLPDEGGGIKVLQEEGEVIFVPSGWHHQVLNLDFCISINHNYFASPTLSRVFDALISAQTRVEDSIRDILPDIQSRLGMDGPWQLEWAEEVQSLLERDAGWGWKGFWETVSRNVKSPPAPNHLSPTLDQRNGFIRVVITRYKELPEWVTLEEVKRVVEDIEHSIEM